MGRIEVPLEVRNGRYEPLLGYLALEELRVAVDLVQQRLVKLPYVDLKSVAA